jgi:hypothetical protein
VSTTAPALLAAGGWLASAVVAVLVAPEVADRTIEIRSGRPPADASLQLLALVVAPIMVAYLGWVWWSVAALVNARRLAPLSGSPLWPVAVYVGGPLLVVASAGSAWTAGSAGSAGSAWTSGTGRDLALVAGVLLCTLGHLTVLVSLRSAAARSGARAVLFTRLLWVPIFAAPVRVACLVFVAGDWTVEEQVMLDLGLQMVLSLWMAHAVREATTSFDRACRTTLARRTAGDELTMPPAHLIATALRRSWES